MIPAAFEYERADSVDDAVKLLSQSDGDAKLIAGGHSLLPLMRLRLSTPSLLIDIDRIADLSYVRDAGDMVEIGALSRMGDLAKDPVLAQHNPMMAHVAGQVGDPQVRHRGTIGGSVAHGDPASDLPAVLLISDGSITLQGPGGQRTVAAADLFRNYLETSIEPTEVLTENGTHPFPQRAHPGQALPGSPALPPAASASRRSPQPRDTPEWAAADSNRGPAD